MTCDYTILGTRQTSVLSPLGGYVPAQEVAFSVKGAGTQRITLPESEFTPESVKAAIEARCAAISGVLGLNG